MFKVGDRVRVTQDFDYTGRFGPQSGDTGTITNIDSYGSITILFDKTLRKLDGWTEGELVLLDDAPEDNLNIPRGFSAKQMSDITRNALFDKISKNIQSAAKEGRRFLHFNTAGYSNEDTDFVRLKMIDLGFKFKQEGVTIKFSW